MTSTRHLCYYLPMMKDAKLVNTNFLVKALRRALGYNLSDFAREIGVTKQALWDIESEKYKLTPRVYKLLEAAVRRIMKDEK